MDIHNFEYFEQAAHKPLLTDKKMSQLNLRVFAWIVEKSKL